MLSRQIKPKQQISAQHTNSTRMRFTALNGTVRKISADW